MRTLAAGIALLVFAGCSGTGTSSEQDGSAAGDGGPTADAGGTDAGRVDAGGGTDAGGPDAGSPDAGGPDAGPPDGGRLCTARLCDGFESYDAGGPPRAPWSTSVQGG